MTGCGLLPSTPGTIPGTGPALEAQELQQWQLRGKIGVVAQGKAHSAYFNWQQYQSDYHLQLTGPLGRGAVQLDGSSAGPVTLRQSGQPPRMGESPEALLKDSLQWDLPISELYWWIRGLAAPDNRFKSETYADGAMHQLQQSGWTVDYDRYGLYQGYSLPEKIRLQRHDLRLTILIKGWSTIQSPVIQSPSLQPEPSQP